MIPVTPNTITTLVLDKHHMCWGRFMTARNALKKLITKQVKGWDADTNIVSWDGSDLENVNGPASSINWQDMTVGLYPDNPCLRSAPNVVTGAETMWAIPTIVVCTRWWGTKQKRGESISLKRLHKIQKGICQYCGDYVPLAEATKDHIYPKDLGGSNDDFNLALACRPCNARKANLYPYLDKDGKIPKGVKQGHLPTIDVDIRPEWRSHLHLPEVSLVV